MSSNPFATKAAEAAPAVTPAATPDAPEWADDAVVEEANVSAVDEASEHGSFEEVKADKSSDIPKPRFNKVIAQRNELREKVSGIQQALDRANGKLETYERLEEVIGEKYRTNPDLLHFDASFMETFEQHAKADPTLAQAAAKIRGLMGASPVNEPTPAVAPAVAPAIDPGVAKILQREAGRTITEVLTEKGVKDSYIRAASRDVLANVALEDLADVTPETIVELAKVYFKETGIPASEFLAPRKPGSAKPSTSASARPAVREAVEGEASEAAPETPKFKTLDEYNEHRTKRFAKLARETLS